jgi:hypothetical protein
MKLAPTPIATIRCQPLVWAAAANVIAPYTKVLKLAWPLVQIGQGRTSMKEDLGRGGQASAEDDSDSPPTRRVESA